MQNNCEYGIDRLQEGIKFFEKPVVTKFVNIGGKEFNLLELCGCLDKVVYKTESHPLKATEVQENLDIMHQLVEIGLVSRKVHDASKMYLFYSKDWKVLETLLGILSNELRR